MLFFQGLLFDIKKDKNFKLVSRYLKIFKYHLLFVFLISSLGIFIFHGLQIWTLCQKTNQINAWNYQSYRYYYRIASIIWGSRIRKNTVCGCTYMHIQSSLVHICIGLSTCICQQLSPMIGQIRFYNNHYHDNQSPPCT